MEVIANQVNLNAFSLIFNLRPQNSDTFLPPFTGHLVRGVALRLIKDVNPEISESLKSTYDQNNNDCILMIFPSAAHLSDFYFGGYYSQIFLYYMERFMFLEQ